MTTALECHFYTEFYIYADFIVIDISQPTPSAQWPHFLSDKDKTRCRSRDMVVPFPYLTVSIYIELGVKVTL